MRGGAALALALILAGLLGLVGFALLSVFPV